MTQNDRDQTTADLAWVAERLDMERPLADSLELDRMKLQARKQAARAARSRPKGSLLKSRVAITAILMLGLVTGGTGTTLALQDGGSSNAAQVQYPREAPTGGGPTGGGPTGGGPTDRVLGTQQGGEGEGDVAGTTESSPNPVQGGQQVVAAQSDSNLPFTGLAAVPLIVLGLGLIAAGMMLFRSARREPSGA